MENGRFFIKYVCMNINKKHYYWIPENKSNTITPKTIYKDDDLSKELDDMANILAQRLVKSVGYC